MSVSRLPSGRYRAQTYDPATKRYVSSARVLGLTEATFPTEAKARRADAKAAELLAEQQDQTVTLADWANTWTTDPLYQRKKTSTNIHNRERIHRFVQTYGTVPLASFDGDRGDKIVAEWIAGGQNLSTVASLKTMFNDAASAKAGRLIRANPFAGLNLPKSRGRADENPPTEDEVRVMLEHASRITAPGFAAWLTVAAWTGMRPGELDAMRWDWVDFAQNRIMVREQWNVKERAWSLPKNGKTRLILLTPQAREALLANQNGLPLCFANTRGGHWTTSARSHHWDRVRAVMGWLERDSRKALYLATRHFAGWYLYNVLELPAEDVAIQLGHEDGGELVRLLYGHRDRARTLVRIERAFAERRAVEVPGGLRMIRGDAS